MTQHAQPKHFSNRIQFEILVGHLENMEAIGMKNLNDACSHETTQMKRLHFKRDVFIDSMTNIHRGKNLSANELTKWKEMPWSRGVNGFSRPKQTEKNIKKCSTKGYQKKLVKKTDVQRSQNVGIVQTQEKQTNWAQKNKRRPEYPFSGTEGQLQFFWEELNFLKYASDDTNRILMSCQWY